MTLWQRYVTKNPMKAETRRSFRRFFGIGKMSQGAVRFGIGLFTVLYLLIFGVFFVYAKDSDPAIWVYVELVILLLVSSIGFYSSISGERERRTWDVLRSLPVTRTQIVVGKFLGAVVVTTVVWASFMPFNLLDIFVAKGSSPQPPIVVRLPLGLMGSLIPYFAAILTLALTLLLSARCRTSITALCTSLAALFLWLAVWPLILGLFMAGSSSSGDFWELTMNPFVIIAMVFGDPHPFAAFFSFLVFCAIAVAVFVTWTDQTLSFLEDQVEFVRPKENA